MDADVLKAVRAVTFHYRAEKRRHSPTTDHLGGEVKRLFTAVKEVCEWRLGRSGAAVGAGGDEDGAGARYDDPAAVVEDRSADPNHGAQSVDIAGDGIRLGGSVRASV